MDYVDYVRLTARDSILAADGELYEFLTCTVALCFPEAFLSLSILYLRIQLVAASIRLNEIFTLYDQP